jgi:hypothetical protein
MDELRAGPAEDPDRYVLWTPVGGGGEGVVYRSTRELQDGHVEVAVKALKLRVHRGANAADVAQRWVTQATRLRNFSHPGIVGVQEAFLGPPPHPEGQASEEATTPYFVMAWVEGTDLRTWAESHPNANERLAVLESVADALDEFHAAGQVHADVKPANIIVRRKVLPTGSAVDVAVLVDFGLMRTVEGAPASTVVGGTEGYWAPEAIEGRYSPASDLYALAAVAVFLLTGEPPVQHGAPAADAHRRLLAAGFPGTLANAIVAPLATDPAARPTNGAAGWLAEVRRGTSSRMTATQPIATASTTVMAEAGQAPPSESHKSRRGLIVAAGVVLALALIGAAVAVGANGGGGGENPKKVAAVRTSTTDAPTTTSSTLLLGQASTTSVAEAGPASTLPPNGERLDGTYITERNGAEVQQAVKINAVLYSRAVVGSISCYGSTAYMDFDLNRKKTRVTSTAGILDSSPAGSFAVFEVFVDGRLVQSTSAGLGRSIPIEVNVTGALRLRLAISGSEDGECHGGSGGFGDPMVYA